MSIWIPSHDRVKDSHLKTFTHHIPHKNYQELHQWSIDNLEDFWSLVWDYTGIIGDKGNIVIENQQDVEGAVFFKNAHLNFAENLLRLKNNEIAITFITEDKDKKTLTYQELYQWVAKWVVQLQLWNVKKGDRVVGYLPNLPETVIAMLATASIGAIWSACSPDFGPQGVIDRFEQIKPKIFITCDGYYYNGKVFNCLERLPAILPKLPSVEQVVVVPYLKNKTHLYFDWNLVQNHTTDDIKFERFPFNHPLYILYSSGTTGVPKCIVHGAGGTLLQHLKEHQLHCDIKAGEKVFYYTTCSWMMWHWLVSSLASKAHIILYDGSPVYPKTVYLIDLAEKHQWHFFGASAKYFSMLDKESIKVTDKLSNLKVIASTGSPLLPETFDYIYGSIKKDVAVHSISGGTDIISCFMLGNPASPVYRGEIQGAGLGMAVEVFDDQGHNLLDGIGELVCTKPFPSRPLGFWENSSKYHETYYQKFPKIWHHGDLIEKTKNGGFIIHGRSDAVLNPGGVRIGTSEIYRQVEQLDQVLESLAVGQKWNDDERIILFVVLKPKINLDEQLIQIICKQIKENTTPRHVPAKIIQVSDLPRTKNNKIAELAVKKIIHGEVVSNQESLLNPQSLELFVNLKELNLC